MSGGCGVSGVAAPAGGVEMLQQPMPMMPPGGAEKIGDAPKTEEKKEKPEDKKPEDKKPDNLF